MTTLPHPRRTRLPPGLGTPLFCLILSGVAYAYLLAKFPKALAAELTPATWPNVMLLGCVATAAFMCLQALWRHRAWGSAPANSDGEVDVADDYNNRAMLLGLSGIVAYGFLIDVIGFAFATLALIAYWLIMDGIRRPRTVVLTSVLGTVTLLYSFVKVAYTPLPRGEGVFDTATIAIYRFLGIF